jgi:glutamyl/glutaminyl-tRNA synthetase
MLSERLTFGDVFWPIRVALSGREQSPSPDELLSVLPRDIILQRLKKAVQSLS